MQESVCSDSHWRLKVTFPVFLQAKSIYKSKLKTAFPCVYKNVYNLFS